MTVDCKAPIKPGNPDESYNTPSVSETLYEQRIRIANEAIRHEEPERIPIWINYGTTPFVLSDDGTTYRDAMYNHEAAARAIIKFHLDFQPDVQFFHILNGKAEEIAGTKYIDWPGRPGSSVPNDSIFQVREYEFLKREEYPELLSDFTGFMLHKYIPRAFPGLEGLSAILNPVPCGMMFFEKFSSMYGPKAAEAYEKLIEIGKLQAETQRVSTAISDELTRLGFPPMVTGVGLVPFDLLSNYFRGTVATFEDLIECPDMIEKAVDMFADLQIANLQYFRYAPLPVKRVMFWMHKGMDGFMSPKQFDDLYWKPFLKVIYALVDMEVTPIIYTEGNYYKRIDQMKDIPPGKCVIHFENVDLEYAKKTIGAENCITSNFPIYLLEHGTKEQVIEEAKREIDICAPGGGFIFETNASIMTVKRENLEALYDTVREYGRK